MSRIKRVVETIIILLILFFNINTVKAYENVSLAEKSETFEQWENLEEDKRNDLIQPSYFDETFKDSIKRSTYNSLLSAEANFNLESKYDLRNVLSNIIVKNQKQVGACWVFTTSSIFETTMAKRYNINSLEYSPMHIDYKTSQIFNRQPGSGGNLFISLAYSASGYGPVYESDLPFNSVYDEQNNSKDKYYLSDISSVDLTQSIRTRVEDATVFSSIYKVYTSKNIIYKDSASTTPLKTYTEQEVKAMRDLIKQHIKDYGAVAAQFYADSSGELSIKGKYISNYYNNETNAYYCNENGASANHTVTIVGWDDTYSKENFAQGNKPFNDGAYIVLNSWGTEFGDNGYFYVSYDDVCIEEVIVGINSMKQIKNSEYDKMYEYDELGITYPIYAMNDDETEYLKSAYAANVFSRENISNKNEYLSEIGIFLGNAEGVQVYINPNNDNLNQGELVATYTGANALDAGYHTLELASPILLTGDKFAVKIKYSNSEITQIPIECNLYDSGLTSIKDNIHSTAKSNFGESFISKDGTNWTDLSDYVLGDYKFKNSNACIKAFSTYSDKMLEVIEENKQEPQQEEQETIKDEEISIKDEEISIKVTGIKLNTKTYSMQVGDSSNLVATIEPQNATNKNVTWTSSNEDVATISERGIITALKEGTTIITAKTNDGNYTAQCEITVTKKVNNDDDIYKSNDELEENNLNSKGTQKVQQTDNTKASGTIPYAGKSRIILTIIILTITSIIIYLRYKNFKDMQ